MAKAVFDGRVSLHDAFTEVQRVTVNGDRYDDRFLALRSTVSFANRSIRNRSIFLLRVSPVTRCSLTELALSSTVIRRRLSRA
jgi:hypothetical protein